MTDQEKLQRLAPLAEFIDSFYGNDTEHIKSQLLETVYMLHYIDHECFDQKQVQEKSFLLYRLAEMLTS